VSDYSYSYSLLQYNNSRKQIRLEVAQTMFINAGLLSIDDKSRPPRLTPPSAPVNEPIPWSHNVTHCIATASRLDNFHWKY